MVVRSSPPSPSSPVWGRRPAPQHQWSCRPTGGQRGGKVTGSVDVADPVRDADSGDGHPGRLGEINKPVGAWSCDLTGVGQQDPNARVGVVTNDPQVPDRVQDRVGGW